MTYPQGGQDPDGGGSTVLDQGSGDDLQGLGHGAVRPLFDAGQSTGTLHQTLGHSHLCGAAAWQQEGVQQHVTADLHSVLQVPLHLLRIRDRVRSEAGLRFEDVTH